MMRGEVWWADLSIPFGSEPGFRRPVLIVQADSFNRSSISTIVCVPFTTNMRLGKAPGNTLISASESGLGKDSVAVVSQLTVLDRARLVECIGKTARQNMQRIESGIRLLLDLS